MAEDAFGSAKKAEYPWQLELPPWAPAAKLTESERRCKFARHTFEWEKMCRSGGWGSDPLLCWNEEKGFYEFGDGTFALSRERANWPALKDAGFFSEWGM